jgi:AraC-like DNA-binding protein
VTRDQGYFRLSETIAYNPEVSTTSGSSLPGAQDVLRTRYLRSGAGAVAAETARTGLWGRGLAGDRSAPGSSFRMRACGSESSTVAQLLSSAHEDIARLTDVLRDQQCFAALRGFDGVILPIDTSAASNQGNGAVPALSAPIYDADGRVLASLELCFGVLYRSDSSGTLLRALLESAARSMTERWFRLTHRKQWIVAALRRNAPHTCIILAVDRDHRVVAADSKARQLFEQKCGRFEKRLPLSTLFQSTPALLRRRGHGDSSIALRGSSDGEPWIALVTAPDIGAIRSEHDARTLLHVRPRLDCLTRLLSVPPEGEPQRGLPRSTLKRVEEHIDANLDSALDVEELAALVQMSPSHFTRSFNRSVGLTPHRYVIQCRVAKARELLATTELPLIEIALSIGFSDQSHFSRRFQELVGVPPGAYRRSDRS